MGYFVKQAVVFNVKNNFFIRNVKVSKVEKVDSQCYRQAFLYFHY